jgi:murein DD-endopeptidase MepM/ murein hydrolase activator NlpD
VESARLAAQVSTSESPSPPQQAAPAPTATPASQLCDTRESGSLIFCVYTVQDGDTLSGIAGKLGFKGNDDLTSWEMLAQSNLPDITSVNDFLQPGQKIRVPVQTGIIHMVKNAQTLTDLAEMYDASLAEIVAVAGNRINNLDTLTVGQEVLVPNPTRTYKPPPAPAAPASASTGGGGSGQAQVVRGGAQSRSGFIWPVGGPISSYFGPAHPLGIDIDLFSSPNAPIGAVASGVVTFAGGNACCSYGLYVIVDHGNGFQTLYAHLSRISVSSGQRVAQGQVLGSGGRTGYATGNHLHFEVHVNGAIVNPMAYLP